MTDEDYRVCGLTPPKEGEVEESRSKESLRRYEPNKEWRDLPPETQRILEEHKLIGVNYLAKQYNIYKIKSDKDNSFDTFIREMELERELHIHFLKQTHFNDYYREVNEKVLEEIESDIERLKVVSEGRKRMLREMEELKRSFDSRRLKQFTGTIRSSSSRLDEMDDQIRRSQIAYSEANMTSEQREWRERTRAG